MKKTMLIVILLTGLYTQASAQRGNFKNLTPRERAEMQTERMASGLGLSEDQKKAVYEINLQSAEKNGTAKRQGREALKATQQEKEEQYRKVLTEEQFQKYQELKKERMEQIRSRRR